MATWTTTDSVIHSAIRKDASIYEEYLNSEVTSGTKYLGPRKGDASAMDGTSAVDALRKRKALVGEGSYVVGYFSPADGKTPLPYHVVECNGRAFTTNAEGRITYIDENWLDEEYEQVKFVEEYVHKIAKVCKTNAMLRQILTLPMDEVISLCIPGGMIGSGKFASTAAENAAIKSIDDVNCLPSVLTMYPPNSMLEGQAYAKLTMLIRKFMPAVKPREVTKPKHQNDPPNMTPSEYASHVTDVGGSEALLSERRVKRTGVTPSIIPRTPTN